MKNQSSLNGTTSMKNIAGCIQVLLLLCICCLFLQAPVLAISNNTSNSSASTVPEQSGVSEFSHLIELYFEDDNYVIASESIVYSTGSANDGEELVLWIPENAEIMQFQVADMTGSVTATSVNYSREDNFLYFPSYSAAGSGGMPLLYRIRYVVHSQEDVTIFRKLIREEGVFGYPVSRLIIVVNHEEGEVPAITSKEGFSLVADEAIIEGNYTSYAWLSPQFNEFNVTLKNQGHGTKTGTGYNYSLTVGIVLLAIVIAAMLFYKKSDSGNPDELEDLYEAELAVLTQIKEDRKKKKLSREEFDSLHKKHSENASKIKSKMEKLKKT